MSKYAGQSGTKCQRALPAKLKFEAVGMANCPIGGGKYRHFAQLQEKKGYCIMFIIPVEYAYSTTIGITTLK